MQACVVVVNPQIERFRCFDFVTYSKVERADAAMATSPQAVDRNTVELKRAVSREDSARPGAHATAKKLLVGGLRGDVAEGDLIEHFLQLGTVEEVEIIADKQSEAVVVKVHPIQGHYVEVKRFVSKDSHSWGGLPVSCDQDGHWLKAHSSQEALDPGTKQC
ncbi:heterogeneous nuclear ribonucleoprotein A0-like [Carlito syrichta]|uniref:Heterogeneous nuclear ribonucleoprotein A0-like n=1 Tax=Carlito syrichta TaxID=1868482 RepID=A0A3Q0E7Z0_CARSF|nr:heterogeneous nuclear ribonucleoprotein A0-like [Carlito syrichta]